MTVPVYLGPGLAALLEGWGRGVRAAGGETVRLRTRLRRDFEGRPKVQLKFWRKKRIGDALFFKQLS